MNAHNPGNVLSRHQAIRLVEDLRAENARLKARANPGPGWVNAEAHDALRAECERRVTNEREACAALVFSMMRDGAESLDSVVKAIRARK